MPCFARPATRIAAAGMVALAVSAARAQTSLNGGRQFTTTTEGNRRLDGVGDVVGERSVARP